MRQFFSNHPVIEYRGLKLRNIMLSAKLVQDVLSKTTLVYPYTLDEGETPTMLAYDYYGSIDYVWLIFYTNNITDPYTQWYKSQEQFHEYIIKKYGSIESALSTTHHYVNTLDSTYPEVSPTTYQYASLEEQGTLSPVSSYDWEVAQNEQYRTINLIDKSYAPRIALELERLLK